MKPNKLSTTLPVSPRPSRWLVAHVTPCTEPAWRERLVAGGLWAVALAVIAIFAWIVGDLLVHGAMQITPAFLLQPPRQAGRAGGISTVLIGTLYIVGVALGSALPVGLGTAVWLAELSTADTAFARVVRRSLDILAGVPSIVFGLFGLAFFGQFLGWGWSILSGGLTLACMILPVLVRSTEESLRAVPQSLCQGAAALGLSRRAELWQLTLPAAATGIAAGLMLSLGRALAETAALLFTAGTATRMPTSLLDSARSLSYHIYLLAIEIPGGQARAYASAVVLVTLGLTLNGCAALVVKRWQR
jgi:phosphate transport system permease protein